MTFQCVSVVNRWRSLVVERQPVATDPRSIPVAIIFIYEFCGVVVQARAVILLGPGFDPRQECLYTEDTGRIIDRSTFGSLDGNLSTSSRGIMCMLYMYCERAVQNRQDVCAVHRRTASLQYNLVLYIQMWTGRYVLYICDLKSQELRLEVVHWQNAHL